MADIDSNAMHFSRTATAIAAESSALLSDMNADQAPLIDRDPADSGAAEDICQSPDNDFHRDLDRSSHNEIIRNERDYSTIHTFWRQMIGLNELPGWISGDSGSGSDGAPQVLDGQIGGVLGSSGRTHAGFQVTDLQEINKLGAYEFASADPRYKRRTFALRIGYDGSQYAGYQKQIGGISTVEEDLTTSLGRTVVAAGRTDKGVSAVSQIVSFKTFEEISPEDIIRQLKATEPFQQGKLNVWEVARMPKKFNALFSAMSRRYIYLFPLKIKHHSTDNDVEQRKTVSPATFDIDVAHVNTLFNR